VRRAVSTFFHIGVLFSTLACGNRGDRKQERPEGFLKVALLTPGPISDQSWNAGAYAGLLRIRDSLGAQISHVQTRSPVEFDENFREYGRQGYALVFGHGFEFQDAARRVAPAYPSTVFVVTSSMLGSRNAIGMNFKFDEPCYLAGIIAGATSKSGILGLIGGTELPPVKSGFAAFAAGARRSNPKVKILTSYIGNWDDVAAGKEQALAVIAQGADIIFQNADAAGLGVFQAARETRKAFVFGSNADQTAVAPDVVLGSVVIDLAHAFLGVARQLQAGTLTAPAVSLGADADAVRLTLNPALSDRIPAPTRQAVDSLWRELRAGRATLPAVSDSAAAR
jgi:basic membrane protein A and related proteins